MLATVDGARHAPLTLVHQDFLAPGRMLRGTMLTAALLSRICLSARLIVLVLSVQVKFSIHSIRHLSGSIALISSKRLHQFQIALDLLIFRNSLFW